MSHTSRPGTKVKFGSSAKDGTPERLRAKDGVPQRLSAKMARQLKRP